MEAAVQPRSWKEEFAFAAAMREEDVLYREKLARVGARQRQITEEQRIVAQRQEAETRTMIETALAAPARIASFGVKLDSYDAKTVEALIENQEAMERVRNNLNDMLGRAHVLPDGRRVFKTKDGQNVIDEHGQALAEDTIHPDMIDDRRTKWETYKAERDEERRLQQDRTQLLHYQERLDRSRERLGRDGLTDADLTRLENDLRTAMPDAVRRKAGLEETGAQPPPGSRLTSLPDGMDALMRQTGLGPSAPGMR